jgi:hypothetical protein
VDGTFDRSRCGCFECEATLPGAARPGDRDEPNIGTGKQGLRMGEIVPPADEAVVEGGQRCASKRREWREALIEARDHELVERLGGRDVLEPVATETSK